MQKTYSFTTKSYPTNDLLELDLESHKIGTTIRHIIESIWSAAIDSSKVIT